MKNYKQIAEDASNELNGLRQQKAVLDAKINDQVKALGLDPTKPLKEQIDAKLEELRKKGEEKEAELEQVLKELENYKLDGDEVDE